MTFTIPPATYLPDFLAFRAGDQPDKPCWIFGERTWSWSEAWESVRRAAGALMADGVQRQVLLKPFKSVQIRDDNGRDIGELKRGLGKPAVVRVAEGHTLSLA